MAFYFKSSLFQLFRVFLASQMLKDPVATELIKSSWFYINCGVRVISWGNSSLVIGLQGPTMHMQGLQRPENGSDLLELVLLIDRSFCPAWAQSRLSQRNTLKLTLIINWLAY